MNSLNQPFRKQAKEPKINCKITVPLRIQCLCSAYSLNFGCNLSNYSILI